VTQPRVLALRAGSSRSYRRAFTRERLREGFWAAPSLLLVSGALFAVLTVQARHLGVPASLLGGLPVDPGQASGILGIIASSTLTFLGVVFTLTLVALQLASSQLSPRVLRMFVRSAVTKLAFGILLATFSYAVVFLVLAGGRGHEADSRGVTVAMALVSLSLIVFVVFVAKTMKLLQVAWVISGVADETRAALRHRFPAASAYLPAAPPALSGARTTIHLPAAARWGRGRALGVVQGVDRGKLTELGRRHDCVLQLLVRIGEYLPGEAAVVAAFGEPPPERAVLASISLGRTRTLYQDPAFGLRQLVDIAIQALSPAVNQPTTAVQVIDRVEDIMLRIAGSPDCTGLFADAAGQVRYVEPAPGWEECLDLAFTEIADYGASSAQVVRRLLAAYDALEAAVPEERRPGLAKRRAVLVQASDREGLSSAGLRADALGLG
jgi:uncharacterized membrane protein